MSLGFFGYDSCSPFKRVSEVSRASQGWLTRRGMCDHGHQHPKPSPHHLVGLVCQKSPGMQVCDAMALNGLSHMREAVVEVCRLLAGNPCHPDLWREKGVGG